MELLYKYYSGVPQYQFDNLENGNISFSSIDTLNDPFEGIGAFFYQTSDKEQEFWKSMGAPNFPEQMEDMASYDGHEMTTFYYRIFSTTKNFDNPLLWAYYANSHKGFCVGYDKSAISDVSDEMFDIDYSDTMYQFSKFDDETCKKLLSIKSAAWNIEDECRALYIIKDTDISHLPHEDCFGKKHCDQKLYRSNIYNDPAKKIIIEETLCADKYISVKCPPMIIYLGLWIETNTRERVIKIARHNGIKIYQMTQNKNSFGFIPQEVL